VPDSYENRKCDRKLLESALRSSFIHIWESIVITSASCSYNLNDLLVTISIYMLVDDEAMKLIQLGISRQDMLF
jgi:hypothetical protein